MIDQRRKMRSMTPDWAEISAIARIRLRVLDRLLPVAGFSKGPVGLRLLPGCS